MSWCTSRSQFFLRDPDPSPVLTVTMGQGQGTTRRGSCLVKALSRQELLPISTVRACYWQTMAAASKECEQHVINNLLKHCQLPWVPVCFCVWTIPC